MDGKQVKQRNVNKQPGSNSSSGTAKTQSKNSNASKLQKKSSLMLSVIQGLFIIILFFFLSSYLITDTWLWGYKGKYVNWYHWFPRELALYDGTDPSKPIYLAVKGEVFDVTAGRPYYARGGGYGFFSGRDASRAYTTGCFETHLTHDLRGLTPAQISDIDGWANFYRNHQKYFKVGTVILDPIDPNSPIPEDCNKPVAAKPAS
ncbi:hypothetical protein BGX26_006715 [Mortierella sp. AD094]|nr:hypothetical protein BGX26_006715 [Mortierella sp. AD094]